MTKLALSIDEVIAVTGLGRTSIFKAIKTGRLPVKKHGVRTLIMPEDLEAFVAGLPTKGRNSAGEDDAK